MPHMILEIESTPHKLVVPAPIVLSSILSVDVVFMESPSRLAVLNRRVSPIKQILSGQQCLDHLNAFWPEEDIVVGFQFANPENVAEKKVGLWKLLYAQYSSFTAGHFKFAFEKLTQCRLRVSRQVFLQNNYAIFLECVTRLWQWITSARTIYLKALHFEFSEPRYMLSSH